MSGAAVVARPAAFPVCRRCLGTGRFITGTLNGKPTGPGGECFRCGGKGWQDEADRKRNEAYDRHMVRRACAGMMAGAR